MHDNSALSPEPCVQVWNTRDAVALLHYSISTCLQQMFVHVALEIGQQLHLLLKLRWIGAVGEVRLLAFLVDEVNVTGK